MRSHPFNQTSFPSLILTRLTHESCYFKQTNTAMDNEVIDWVELMSMTGEDISITKERMFPNINRLGFLRFETIPS
jgi:hypothetical protein